MDEVRAERLMKKFGNKVLLVLIYWWPKEKYKKNPELMPGLEYLVWYNSVPTIQCLKNYSNVAHNSLLNFTYRVVMEGGRGGGSSPKFASSSKLQPHSAL
jgi:hypothetical protein